MRQTAVLINPQQAHAIMSSLWASCIKPALNAGQRLVVEVKPETRTTEQNSRMWAMLGDVAQQVDWYGKKLSPEDWKTVFTAALKKCQAVPGIDGGFVVLGLSTSRMSKQELSELMELIAAFGAEREVVFHEYTTDAEHA
jgi:hypothetical protein